MFKSASFLHIALFAVAISGCSVRPLYYDDYNKHNTPNSLDNITVGIIANHDGQKLRSYLKEYLRNIRCERMHLDVALERTEKTFVLDAAGVAHKIQATYNAKICLRCDADKSIVTEQTIAVLNTYNIARAQGEVMLSLYGKNDWVLLKELARRIAERIKMSIEAKKVRKHTHTIPNRK